MLEQIWKNKKAQIVYSLFGTILFFMAANGFACLNLYPQHDALNYSFFFAGEWELVLGRFLLPVYGMIRGNVLAPWMVGMLSMLYLTITVFLVTEMLDLHKPVYILLTAGFLSANMMMTEVLGVFTYVGDAFMLSVLLAVLGVYLAVRVRSVKGCIFSALCFFASFGLYQAFVTVAMVLYIAVICREAQQADKVKKEDWIRWVQYLVPVVAGAVLYFIVFKATLAVFGLAEVQYYDSISSLSSLDVCGTIKRSLNYYRYYPYIFIGMQCLTGTATKIANAVLFTAGFYLLWKNCRQKRDRVISHLIFAAGVLAIPIASLLTDILMSGRSITYRTAFAVYLIYPVLLCIFSSKKEWISKGMQGVLFLCCGIVLYQNIVYSNAAYATQKVLYDRALVDVGRVLNDINRNEDYIMNETEVVVIGDFQSNEHIESPDFDGHVMDGFEKNAVTYAQTFESFVHLLGEDINQVSDGEVLRQYQESAIVENMPSFPQYGYCQMMDGRMVIKLSEVEE